MTNFLEKNAHWILGLAIGAALLAGGIYAFILGNRLRFLPDEAEYLQLATHLAEGLGFSLDGRTPTAFRAPGYPLLLSVFVALGAGVIHLRLVNVLSFGLSLPLVFTLLQRHGSRLAAVLGVLYALAYPVLLFTAGTLYPQTLAALLFLASLALVTTSPFHLRQAVLAGLTLGVLILTIPIFLITLPILAWWKIQADKAHTLRPVLVMTLVTLACLGFWTARNAAALGAAVPLTTSTGINLLYGNSENSTPNGGTTIDISVYEDAAQYLNELDRDRTYRAAVLTYVRNHPFRTLGLYGLKVLNYFHFRNQLETQAESTDFRAMVMAITYLPLLAIGLLRLLRRRIHPLTRFEILLGALYLGSALAYGVFFPRIRFRLPFDYLLIMLVALFLSRVLRPAQPRDLGWSAP